jgi:DNA-binding transcriptional regulator YdaS (Cro superfamily)
MDAAIRSGMDRAIALAGGTKALATALGISSQAVSQWKRVPTERVLEVEALTGVSRYELRPDIYGTAENAARLAKVRKAIEARP